jgi:hypothetical protein
MSKALVPVTPNDWAMIKEIAPVAATARMFGVTEQQAAIVMLKGHELGLGLAAAFEFIDVIDGKPSIKPKGALALIHNSNELAGIRIEDKANSCTVWMKRKNGFEYTATFSLEDAKRAGLVKPKGGWEKYPANMLRWRAVGYCADVVFPDVIGGMLRPEELGAEVDQNGEVQVWAIKDPEAEILSTAPSPKKDTPLSKFHAMPIYGSIEKLLAVEGWTAERIVVAGEGKLPSTPEECQAIAEKLEAEDARK